MDDNFLAYTAGYVDAEGCIRMFKLRENSWQLDVNFSQTNPVSALSLQSTFGGSIRERVPERGRRQAVLAILGLEAERLLAAIRELSLFKQDQIDLVLGVYRTYRTRTPDSVGHETLEKLSALKNVEIDVNTFPWTRSGYADRGWRESFTYHRQPTPQELAYFAGFLDGDGHLDVDEKRVCIKFEQVDGTPLIRLREIYGGTIRPCAARGKNHRLKAIYKLRAYEAVQQFLKDVLPYCIEKRPQVEAVLNRWAPSMNRRVLGQLKRFLKKERHKEIKKGYVAELKAQGVIKPKHAGIRPVASRRFQIDLPDGTNVVVKAANYVEAEVLREALLRDGAAVNAMNTVNAVH